MLDKVTDKDIFDATIKYGLSPKEFKDLVYPSILRNYIERFDLLVNTEFLDRYFDLLDFKTLLMAANDYKSYYKNFNTYAKADLTDMTNCMIKHATDLQLITLFCNYNISNDNINKDNADRIYCLLFDAGMAIPINNAYEPHHFRYGTIRYLEGTGDKYLDKEILFHISDIKIKNYAPEKTEYTYDGVIKNNISNLNTFIILYEGAFKNIKHEGNTLYETKSN
jgi:hypothetical protein